MSLALVFWLSLLLLCYVYVGYPLLITVWSRLRPRPSRSARLEPSLSILVVAYNEGHRIGRRLENLLSLDYPPDKLEVLVGLDGSTDGSGALARGFRHPRLRFFDYPQRRGKAAVLNDLVGQARGEILVMADARQRFAANALSRLVRHFADPAVGAVSGELILSSNKAGTAVGEGVGFYWRYEKLIRSSESLADSSVGATGAIYAIRKTLFRPLPDDTILDDVLVPMRIARRGYRVLFDPDARAYDRVASTSAEEFTRKVRTIAGNFQLLSREPWMLDPRRNRLWFQTMSHKGLRLVGPALLAMALGANLMLAGSPLYRGTLIAQGLFYLAALGGFLLKDAPRRLPPLTVPYTVCLLNWATVVALLRFLTGTQRAAWEAAAPARALVPSGAPRHRSGSRRTA